MLNVGNYNLSLRFFPIRPLNRAPHTRREHTGHLVKQESMVFRLDKTTERPYQQQAGTRHERRRCIGA